MSYNIQIKGLRELQATFDTMPKKLASEAAGILENGAKTWVRLSKQDAPVDFGVLRNEITYLKTSDLAFEVISGAKYSAYQEWGTITRVNVPEAEIAYAAQFKGNGIRKTGGIYPHPFFFKQQVPVTLQIEKGVSSILNDVKL